LNEQLTYEELVDREFELEQTVSRLTDGLQYLVDLAKEQMDRGELLDTESFILVMQILEVVDETLSYDFSFEGND